MGLSLGWDSQWMWVSIFSYTNASLESKFDLFSTVYNDTAKMPEDSSIMTYRGHRVKKTLIRAKFSPMETTGQRYIYTGCGTGRLIGELRRHMTVVSRSFHLHKSVSFISVYDVLTGKIVNSNRAHKDIVRDVAWHPKRNEILTSSWDCRVCLHSYQLSKRSQLKRCLSQTDCSHDNKSNSSGDNQGPPPRRSRRLANRRLAQETNWFKRDTHKTLNYF